MKITPTSLTVNQLLGSKSEQYVIPPYQRRYSWRRHQVEDLWKDLQGLENGDSHLFGTIVCLAPPHTAGLNQLELVDGQQRLTTISILLHCFLDRLRREGEEGEARDLGGLLKAKAPGEAPAPKIRLDSLDDKQFVRHSTGDISEPAENPRLLQAFRYMRDQLAPLSLTQIETLLYRLKCQAIIIRLDVSEAKDAFKLFETINNRGLGLSATDIIKNFVLGNAARFGEDSLALAREKWAELLSSLDGIAVDTFFRQFMMAHLCRRVTKSEVVNEFQKAFMREVGEAESLPDQRHYAGSDAENDDTGEDETVVEDDVAFAGTGDEEEADGITSVRRVSFSTFVEKLVRRAGIYRQLVLAKTEIPALDRRLRNLRLIRAQPSYGFLMSLRASGCADGDFKEVLRLTEAFLLRRHTTRERTNDNETVFAQLCGVDPKGALEEIRKTYREYYPGDERFRREFAAATFPSRLMDRARYCLEQIELQLQGKYLEVLPAGPDAVHVEHIVPQKIKTKSAKKKFGDWIAYLGDDAAHRHPRFVARIGNLTLFAGELNIGASNNPYSRKKTAYRQSAFKMTKSLPGRYQEFRFDQVEKRSQELADLALKIWPAM